MYKVIVTFRDKQDDGYTYRAGDTFPRDGMTVDAARIAELAGSGNRIGRPLIEVVQEKAPAKKPAAKRRTTRKKGDAE